MTSGRLASLLLFTLLAGGCSILQGGKLLAPTAFGFDEIAPDLYIEAGADESARNALRTAVTRAEAAIKAAWGDTAAQPLVHACITEQCYESSGGRGSTAKVYGKRILLSPRGLNRHYIAHEWTHAELSARLTFGAWRRMPRWFDEGLAAAISAAPQHSEEHWQYLLDSGVSVPEPAEVRTFISMRQWLDAVDRYGVRDNPERRARGEPELHPVYAAAAHAVRPWLAQAGSAGLHRFVELMNDGADFETAYHAYMPDNTKSPTNQTLDDTHRHPR